LIKEHDLNSFSDEFLPGFKEYYTHGHWSLFYMENRKDRSHVLYSIAQAKARMIYIIDNRMGIDDYQENRNIPECVGHLIFIGASLHNRRKFKLRDMIIRYIITYFNITDGKSNWKTEKEI
jgi:hypothetical protein